MFLTLDSSVALKKVRIESDGEGFPVSSLRELKLLNSLRGHPNIVKLIEVIRSSREMSDPGSAAGKFYDLIFGLLHEQTANKRRVLVETRILTL